MHLVQQVTGTEIVGREVELAAIEAFLSASSRRPAFLLIEGSPGIGKTTLWQEALDRARQDSRLVLSCRAVESERSLTYSGLTDLLSGPPEETFSRLPDVQRAALEVALLRRAPVGGRLDQRAVMAAVAGVLGALAEEAPLLVAVDDLQWADRSTLRALAYGLRRLREGAFGFIASMRTGEVPPELDSLLADPRLERLRLGGLSIGALHHMLRAALGDPLIRPRLRRLAEATDGNPLHAIQLARAGGEPQELAAVLEARVRRLPPAARALLLFAALAARPTRELLGRAAGQLPAASEALDLLERDQLLVSGEAGHLRFGHPLFAAAAEAIASPGAGRSAHRRLAVVAGDAEERVLHRALAAGRPSAAIADSLEAAAAEADGRGAPDGAARLLQLGIELTPATRADDACRRRMEVARLLHKAGDNPAAEAQLASLIEQLERGTLRARAGLLLAEIRLRTGGPRAARPAAETALRDAVGDDLLTAEIHLVIADCLWFDNWQLEAADVHIDAALAILDPNGPPQLLARALAAKVSNGTYRALPVDLPLIERILLLDRQAPVWRQLDRAPFLLADSLVMAGQGERAGELLAELIANARRLGDDSSLPTLLAVAALASFLNGDWQQAEDLIGDAVDLTEQVGQRDFMPQVLWLQAMILAARGDVDEAVRAGELAFRQAEADDNLADASRSLATLAFAELCRGDAAAAAAYEARAILLMEKLGPSRPASTVEPEAVEAFVLSGRLEEARAALWEVQARTGRAPAVQYGARALRAEGLLHAATGDFATAVTVLGSSETVLRRAADRFELARTLLALGQVERRAKRWGGARTHLEEALELFESLPAPTWSRQAREELSRLGGRRPSTELSETEAKVAQLAAEGGSTAEIAARLFMAPSTVSANLTRVYQKLGVRSRAELAARLAVKPRDSSV